MAAPPEATTSTPHTCQRTQWSQTPSGANSRNIVVFIDGTSTSTSKNTIIVELYSHIVKNDVQLTYYSSGLGPNPRASLANRVSHEINLVLRRILPKVILSAYRWLSDNYRDGDRIYLFGLSRGAYHVRALALMISRVGLLLPGNNEQIPFAFDLYSKMDDDALTMSQPLSFNSEPTTGSKGWSKYAGLGNTFKRTFCRDVNIHFVGVWDTISSVGFGRSEALPYRTISCDHICYLRHALVLDVRRVKSLPEQESIGSNDDRIKEVWFSGSQSDVTGNNRDELNSKPDLSMLWMRSQAIAAGLELEPITDLREIDDLESLVTPERHSYIPSVLDLTDRIVKSDSQYYAAGGFADVYRGRYNGDTNIKEVAIKAFRVFSEVDENGRDKKMTKMIRRESGIWKMLDHANIVPFLGIAYGFGRQGSISLVSVWMPNGPVHNFLARHGSHLTVFDRLKLLSDIANGLRYLHTFPFPIAHGDLSCNNVLVDHNGSARIADFGHASLLGEALGDLAYLEMSTNRPGTLRWAAPEYCSAEAIISRTTKSDIYSFGNMCLLVLSGKQPWSEINYEAAIVVQLAQGRRPARPDSPPIADQHWELIQRCWSSVDERPHAEELVSCLHQFLRDLS